MPDKFYNFLYLICIFNTVNLFFVIFKIGNYGYNISAIIGTSLAVILVLVIEKYRNK